MLKKIKYILNAWKWYHELYLLINSHFFKRNMCIGHGCYFEETGIWLKEDDIEYLKSIGLLEDKSGERLDGKL